MKDHISTYIADLHATLDRLPNELIGELISLLYDARLNGRQVFIMGNGGSASTATHFAADLAKNTRRKDLQNFRVISLTDNMAIFSAYANDEGYENVFVQQLASFIRPSDVVIGISASGNSMNVIKAIELANQVRARTVALTGFDGGKLGPLVDLHIHVPSNCIEQVEDIHLMIEHMVVKTMKELVQAPLSNEAIEVVPDLQNPIFQAAEVAERIRSSLVLLDAIGAGQDEPDQGQLMKDILGVTVNSMCASSGSFILLDDNGAVAGAALDYEGELSNHSPEQMIEVAERGLAGWVVENRQPALVPDTSGDPRWLPRRWEQFNGMSRSAISVPLIDHNQVMGVLTVVHTQAGRFTRDDLVLLTAIAVYVASRSMRIFNRNGTSNL